MWADKSGVADQQAATRSPACGRLVRAAAPARQQQQTSNSKVQVLKAPADRVGDWPPEAFKTSTS